MKLVFVTGADGFLGRQVCRHLISKGYSVRAGIRSSVRVERLRTTGLNLGQVVALGDIGSEPISKDALLGCDAVIHLAARVHVMNETARDPLAEFRKVNVRGTQELANASLAAGVKHFVFVSSIKVHGEATHGDVFSETSRPKPSDPYAVSKYEAEEWLLNTASSSPLEVTIVRPPLVYGPGVGGNLYRLIEHLYRRLPLVLPPGDNKRSLVNVENIASLLTECVENPKALNQTFLVSDGKDLSTRELIHILASALQRRSMVFTLPGFVTELGKTMRPVRKRLQRLGGSLQIDSSKARNLLAWTPPVCPEAGLTSTAEWFAALRN